MTDDMVGTGLEAALAVFVPEWLTQTWGFGAVHYHP